MSPSGQKQRQRQPVGFLPATARHAAKRGATVDEVPEVRAVPPVGAVTSVRLEDLTAEAGYDWEAGSDASTIGASRIDRAVLRALSGGRGGGGGGGGAGGGSGGGSGGGCGGSGGGGGGGSGDSGGSGRPPLSVEASKSPLLLRAAREARAQLEARSQLRSSGGGRHKSPPSDARSEATPSEASSPSHRGHGHGQRSRPSSVRSSQDGNGSRYYENGSRYGSSVTSGFEASAQERRLRLEELLELKAIGLISNEVFLAKQREILRAL